MPLSHTLLALAAAASSASAAYQGFNYGSTFTDGSPMMQADFEARFKTAAGLQGTNGAFTSARFYTMIQGGTANDPIQGIPAGLSTKTSMLFGLWASAGQDVFNNELAALQKAIDQFCSGGLSQLVAGISIGSEDLYRITPTGIANHAGVGAGPDVLVGYVKQVRDTIKGTCLSDAPLGHVDTWTAYVNGSNKPLIDAVDWLGMDAYPYFENTNPNSIQDGKTRFQSALDATAGVSGGKPVWITETGWPVSGDTSGAAVPSKANARTYWTEVGCPLFGSTNTWWFTLQDASPTTPNPSFGLIGSTLTETPIYDLSCSGSSGSTGPSQPSKQNTSKAKPPPPPPPPSTKPEPQTSAPPSSPHTQPKADSTTSPSSSPPSSSSKPSSKPSSTSSTSSTSSASSASSAQSSTMSTMATKTTNTSSDESTSSSPITSSPTSSPSRSSGGSTTTTTSSSPSTTTAGAPGTRLNSLGAAAVAVVMAVLL